MCFFPGARWCPQLPESPIREERYFLGALLVHLRGGGSMANNPLIDRYYSPLGLELDYDLQKVADDRQNAIENVKVKLAGAKDDSEKRVLLGTLRKLRRTAGR
jgi:hypothetical protein